MRFRIRLSRWLNLRIGGHGEMVSARAHFERWRTEKIIDAIFPWHHKHCELCYRYEMRYNMRYHDFILSELQKENTMQLELFPPPVHCCYCGKLVPQPFFVVKHFGHMTSQLAYCHEEHAHAHYLEKLRERGM